MKTEEIRKLNKSLREAKGEEYGYTKGSKVLVNAKGVMKFKGGFSADEKKDLRRVGINPNYKGKPIRGKGAVAAKNKLKR